MGRSSKLWRTVDKTLTSKNVNLFNDQTISYFRGILKRRQKQSSSDKFLVKLTKCVRACDASWKKGRKEKEYLKCKCPIVYWSRTLLPSNPTCNLSSSLLFSHYPCNGFPRWRDFKVELRGISGRHQGSERVRGRREARNLGGAIRGMTRWVPGWRGKRCSCTRGSETQSETQGGKSAWMRRNCFLPQILEHIRAEQREAQGSQQGYSWGSSLVSPSELHWCTPV